MNTSPVEKVIEFDITSDVGQMLWAQIQTMQSQKSSGRSSTDGDFFAAMDDLVETRKNAEQRVGKDLKHADGHSV